MPASVIADGVERFSIAYTVNLDQYYNPYPIQRQFHASPNKYRLLGGAAGPGKTVALIFDHMIGCNRFNSDDAKEVHTLLLRRTNPKLEKTLITRFREKVPRELYQDFNDTKKVVTWLNGATTQFASMQHAKDNMQHQGQWWKIGYDEMAEFEFKQWFGMQGWNRCPVSTHCTQDGATNPVGVGSGWIRRMFTEGKPASEMDDQQRKQYNPTDYAYFPCTYLDNPIYANDADYIAKLDSYPKAIRDALKFGKWGGVGSYFDIWNPEVHTYAADKAPPIEPWWPKWLSWDWGFEHNSAVQWHTTRPDGVHLTYRELVINHQTSKQIAEEIARLSTGPNGQPEKFIEFHLSHDAFGMRGDAEPLSRQIWEVLQQYRMPDRSHQFPSPSNSTRDVVGSAQLLYELLRSGYWLISDSCENLIETIPSAARDEDNPEEILKFAGDDSLDSARYGLYGRLKAKTPPLENRVRMRLDDMSEKLMETHGHPLEGTDRLLAMKKIQREESRRGKPIGVKRFRPGMQN